MKPDGGSPDAGSASPPALVYVDDLSRGIRRRRHGRGFSYVDASGAAVRDPAVLARIRGLAVPPAWRQVWICPDPAGHIQATGRDERGRKQYRYHADWERLRQETKFRRLVEFGAALPLLRSRLAEDMARRGLCRDRVVAAVVDLLDRTLIRIGNDAYARDNASFGLTTLLNRHVAVEGTALRFSFTGKSGRTWNIGLTDRRLANLVRFCQELPGQRLFQYRDADGELHAVGSGDVNAYLREIAGEVVTSKHFRTWAATVRAAVLLAAEPPPASAREAARRINAALDQVAARLGNTRAVCRTSYVHPLVLDRYAGGALADELAARRPRPVDGLSEEEARVLAWLRRGTRRRERSRAWPN